MPPGDPHGAEVRPTMTTRKIDHTNDTNPSTDPHALPGPLNVLNYFQHCALADASLVLQLASSIIILRESTMANTTVSRGSSSQPPKVKPRQAPDAAGTAKTPRVTMRDMIESVLRDSGRDMKRRRSTRR